MIKTIPKANISGALVLTPMQMNNLHFKSAHTPRQPIQ